MTETHSVGQHDDDQDAGHGHDEIHLPPNSWSPIVLALALTATFIGFIVGAWLWIVGLVVTVAALIAWLRAARTEFGDLPD
jgi:hypothetical protein